MITAHDPAAMSPDERLSEVAGLLGGAYLRLLATGRERQKELEAGPRAEALLGVVNAPENGAGKESA